MKSSDCTPGVKARLVRAGKTRGTVEITGEISETSGLMPVKHVLEPRDDYASPEELRSLERKPRGLVFEMDKPKCSNFPGRLFVSPSFACTGCKHGGCKPIRLREVL